MLFKIWHCDRNDVDLYETKPFVLKRCLTLFLQTVITLDASSGKRNAPVWRPSVRLSVSIFSNLNRTRGEYSMWLSRGSTRRGQRTFPFEYYEDGHTCIFGSGLLSLLQKSSGISVFLDGHNVDWLLLSSINEKLAIFRRWQFLTVTSSEW